MLACGRQFPFPLDSMDLRFGCLAAAMEEIEVAALVRLGNVLAVQLSVTPFVARRVRLPWLRSDQEVQTRGLSDFNAGGAGVEAAVAHFCHRQYGL